jgi:hypothetical protein
MSLVSPGTGRRIAVQPESDRIANSDDMTNDLPICLFTDLLIEPESANQQITQSANRSRP